MSERRIARQACQQVLTTLKVAESLLYNCNDATKLLCLDCMLKDVETKSRAMLPHESILLRPALVTHSAKITQKYKKLHQRSLKYSSLALHSKKKDWHFRNHVGSKALKHKNIRHSHVYYARLQKCQRYKSSSYSG